VTKTLEEMRERAATFAPIEGRAIEDGDFAQVKLLGTPDGGGDPRKPTACCGHIGAEETMEPFNANLKGRQRRRSLRILTLTIRPIIPIRS